MRIAFGGGGSDLPSYYRRHGGVVVSTAIDKYVHVLAATDFREHYVLKHLAWEETDDPASIEHPILRAALEHRWDGRPLELASVGDAPPGTGLGSSGSYAVCVLKALALATGDDLEGTKLAEAACHLEIEVLGRSVGKQDQYAAALGGLNRYTFNPDDTVDVRRLEVSGETRRAIREQFLLFDTGERRSASALLSHQVERAADPAVEATLHRLKELAEEVAVALEAGDLDTLAALTAEQWEVKRRRGPGTVSDRMDAVRDRALAAGAAGVTLLGAGGGGFVLVQARDPGPVRGALEAVGARELAFDIADEGARKLS